MLLSAQVIGTASVLANLSYWDKIRFPNSIKKALNVTRLKIEDTARRMAPKDTGLLKASIWSMMISDTEAQQMR